MSVKTISGPAVEPVGLKDVKDHLRVYHTEEDNLINRYLETARAYIESTMTWRALIEQELEYVLDRFPSDVIKLPRPPLIEVTSIKYTDKDDQEHTVNPGDYIVDADSEPGRVVPAYGKSWPTDPLKPVNGVRIRYKAGYGESAEDVPLEIKQGIFILTTLLYEYREPMVLNLQPYTVPYTIDALVAPFKAWGSDLCE